MTSLYRTCANCAFSKPGESGHLFCYNDLLPSKHPEPIFFAVLKICDNDLQNWKASMGKPVEKHGN